MLDGLCASMHVYELHGQIKPQYCIMEELIVLKVYYIVDVFSLIFVMMSIYILYMPFSVHHDYFMVKNVIPTTE